MKGNIMIVDDEAQVRRYVSRALMRVGYQVQECSNGSQVIDSFNQGFSGVVILDIRLGEESGLEVLEKNKQISPNAQVVMLTGMNDENIGKMALSLGAVDYIVKPFELNYFYEVISVFSLISENFRQEAREHE